MKQDTQALKEKSAPIEIQMSKACVLPMAVEINVFETYDMDLAMRSIEDLYRAAYGVKIVWTD
ncbi:hypothetical protein NB640_00665 [Oxalobacter vibrioformis]|uniref:Uncharacterized protein n=1 Tax=Oxalobacter vibrioformis TaxID=933080 RepID=A0A9E9LWY0_9BURK|nr:hypothetical protein [Oxalobacter vibrioformis]NLC23220.1 hypothetical protein [Oxalobacter sp.]WAW10217.1 hypothetical protein NB640_00665 [Oxalobacter vibrioformis]